MTWGWQASTTEGKVWSPLMDGNLGVTSLPTDSSKMELTKHAVSSITLCQARLTFFPGAEMLSSKSKPSGLCFPSCKTNLGCFVSHCAFQFRIEVRANTDHLHVPGELKFHVHVRSKRSHWGGVALLIWTASWFSEVNLEGQSQNHAGWGSQHQEGSLTWLGHEETAKEKHIPCLVTHSWGDQGRIATA